MTTKQMREMLTKINVISEMMACIARKHHGYYEWGWHNERAIIMNQIEQWSDYEYLVKPLGSYDDRVRAECPCKCVIVNRQKYLALVDADKKDDYWNKGLSKEFLAQCQIM